MFDIRLDSRRCYRTNLRPTGTRLRGWTLSLLVLAGWLLAADSAYAVQGIRFADIPSPRPNGWITDKSGTVSAEAIEYINLACQEINERLKREMCVVVIDSTGGQNHRTFATGLFNHWGVGSAGLPGVPGKWKDNGIMLFAAVKDRRAEIILGDGIDGDEETRICRAIIDDIVVPHFKEGDGNSALYEGIRACGVRIFSVADLDAPPMLPSISATGRAPRTVRRHRQRGLVNLFPWLVGGSILGGLGLLVGGRYYMRYRPRVCQRCSLNMVLLEESDDDQFLEAPELVEEQLGSVDYDVWACLNCEEVMKIRYGRIFTRYSKCPKCWYVTVYKIEKTLINATYSHGGKVRVTEDCKNCHYHRNYNYFTPKRVRSSSSGGSGFSGGGGGSGFGGGRSSGGGAGGGW